MTEFPSDHSGTKPDPAKNSRNAKIVVFISAILFVQLGFILSYVGAFHAPAADGIRVDVVAPSSLTAQIAGGLNSISGKPLTARGAVDMASASAQLHRNDISGIFSVAPTGTHDTLTIATGGGASVATALTSIFQEVEAPQHRQLTVRDAVPVQSGDGRGLTGFYLVTGWLIGGYLLAAVLGILLGTKLAGARQALTRIAMFVPYSVLGGAGGALIVDQWLGALTGHFWAIASIGALVIFAAAMVTVALQSFLGIVGIGVSIVLFVVLGNPSAGGAYQQQLLPPFWRAISAWIPNGAATASLRDVVYFQGSGATPGILLVGLYAAIGVALVFASASIRARGRRSEQPREIRAA